MIKPLCYLSWPLQLDFCDIFFFSLSDNEFEIYMIPQPNHTVKNVPYGLIKSIRLSKCKDTINLFSYSMESEFCLSNIYINILIFKVQLGCNITDSLL